MTMPDYLHTFPSFLIYFVVCLGLLVQFILLYTMLTPYREFRLILDGNTAPAITMGAAILGFVLPLASVVSASVGVLDVMLWGGIAMGVQLLSFVLLNLCFPSLKKAIADGQTSAALLLAQMTLAIGILNAACMSW